MHSTLFGRFTFVVLPVCLLLTGCPGPGAPKVELAKNGDKGQPESGAKTDGATNPAPAPDGGTPPAGKSWAPHGGKWETTETKLFTTEQFQKEVLPNSLRVSPDGTTYAFARNSKWVVNGNGTSFEGIDANDFKFFDGHRYAFSAPCYRDERNSHGGIIGKIRQNCICVDGKQVAGPFEHEFRTFLLVAVSSDGRHTAHAMSTVTSFHQEGIAYVDGKEVGMIPTVPKSGGGVEGVAWGSLTVATAGTIRLAVIRDGVFLDGVKIAPAGKHFAFSANGKAYAYLTSQDGQSFVVVNGKAHKRYGEISEWDDRSFLLSADGDHIVYAAGKGMVHDNKYFDLGQKADLPYSLSPDGKRWACRAGNKIVIDANAGKEYLFPANEYGRTEVPLVFSPDSKQIAYTAGQKVNVKNDKGDEVEKYFQFAVRDGVEQKQFAWVSPNLVFSPDSRRLAYLASDKAEKDAQRYLTVDGVKFGKAYGVQPVFSPDSRSIGFVASRPGESFAVLDNQEQKAYDAIGPAGTRVGFTPDGAYTFIGIRDGAYYWVEARRK